MRGPDSEAEADIYIELMFEAINGSLAQAKYIKPPYTIIEAKQYEASSYKY